MAWANSLGEVLNLPRKQTPDVSVHPAPDTDRVTAIKSLLREAKEQKRKPALKLLVRVLLSHAPSPYLHCHPGRAA
jgi:hypothetical protein